MGNDNVLNYKFLVQLNSCRYELRVAYSNGAQSELQTELEGPE